MLLKKWSKTLVLNTSCRWWMITAGSGWQDEWALQEYVAGSWGESGSAGRKEHTCGPTNPKPTTTQISIYFEISALWTCENVPRPETIVTNVSLKSANTYSSCHFGNLLPLSNKLCRTIVRWNINYPAANGKHIFTQMWKYFLRL